MLAEATARHAPGPIPYGLGLVPALGVPHYFTRASGALLEDVDGNRLIDLHAGSGAVLLGHAAPEVTNAVTRILRDGLVGVPTRLEAAVAERLRGAASLGAEECDLRRPAQRRSAWPFGWRGHIPAASCWRWRGYHGWHDAVTAGIPGQRGIPKALRRLCLGFRAVDPDFLGEAAG